MLDGGEVSILEGRYELVAEGGVNVTTLVLLLPLFHVLLGEILLVEGGFPRFNIGSFNWAGWEDEGGFSGERVLSCCRDNPEVVVLAPSVGTLDGRRVQS